MFFLFYSLFLAKKNKIPLYRLIKRDFTLQKKIGNKNREQSIFIYKTILLPTQPP